MVIGKVFLALELFFFIYFSPSVQQDILWGADSINHESLTGILSTEASRMCSGHVQLADDFEVPSGYVWNITNANFDGFRYPFNSSKPTIEKWTLEFYKDGSSSPGNPVGPIPIPKTLIYHNDSIVPTNGVNVDAPKFEIPEGIILDPGKYWISVYASLNAIDIGGWYWITLNTTNGYFGTPWEVLDTAVGCSGFWVNGSQFKTFWTPASIIPDYDDKRELYVVLYGESSIETITTGITESEGTGGTKPDTASDSGGDSGGNSGDNINSQSSSSGGSNLGVILGSLFGVIAFIILVVIGLLALLFFMKRGKHSGSQHGVSVEMGSSGQPYDQLPIPNSQGPSNAPIPAIPVASPSDQDIDYTELEFENEIGKGAYGVVYKGRWRGGVVAIKQLVFRGTLTEKELNDFRGEAQVMKNLRPHVNVVQFLGITSTPQLCIITEFLDQGSLYNYVFSDAKIDTNVLMNVTKGITAGMLHLHHEGIIHRDLATRNILLGAGFQVKISDFGLSRVAAGGQQSNQTKSDTGPLKWMSPEAIKNREYSRMSDVWAFGVTIWEVVARSEPYPELDPVQTALQVTNNGLRLVPPSYCPVVLTDIMLSCFRDSPQDRPDFQGIWKRLQDARLDEWTLRM